MRKGVEEQVKWTVRAWPPDKLLVDGDYLFWRDYPSRRAAEKAIQQVVRMFPYAKIELAHYEWKQWAWFQKGEVEKW